MGGLVALRMLRHAPSLPIGRVVLLGSPAAGCGTVEQLSRSSAGRFLLGAALPQWTPADALAVVRRVEVGSIAGTRRLGMGPLLGVRLPRANDGVVMVEETVLPGLADHLVLPVSHSGLVVSARVARRSRRSVIRSRVASMRSKRALLLSGMAAGLSLSVAWMAFRLGRPGRGNNSPITDIV